MEPLTPNTAAFLSYLSSTSTSEPTSLPPSAFFPIPGRDTPETSPSSIEASKDVRVTPSDESDAADGHGTQRSGNLHKRKASESDSEPPSGHEGKRPHPSQPARKGGRRKSGVEEEAPASGKKDNKAAKRKEQNRAAQKAFRERREARVKDLESKVAELEQKSYGASVENENLRGILKRLQEENVHLKQSAFTFSVPLSGSGTTPVSLQHGKPPSPPRTVSNDGSLKALHRQASGSGESPDSLNSISSSDSSPMDQLLAGKTFASPFALPAQPQAQAQQAQRQSPVEYPAWQQSASSSSPTNSTSKSEIDALWASFYPQGIDSVLSTQQQHQQQQQPPKPAAQPFTFLNSQPSMMSFASSAAPVAPSDSMAYRDSSAPVAPADYSNSWDMSETSVNEFLASLAGGDTSANNKMDPEDDAFNAQLAFLAPSPSAPFDLSVPGTGTGFSPTNYLNMSPSPIDFQSPDSGTGSASASASGASKSNSASPAAHRPHDVVHVVGKDGSVIEPAALWNQFAQSNTKPSDFVIDDLCEVMRAKATCQDGAHYISIDHAADMFKFKEGGKVPLSQLRKADPSACQRRLNEHYVHTGGFGL